ncbi:6017_t:CDS:2 [Dentiscutata heterogama]|uniref:6017_t:CDS:1 n=1 Tax=Dentiscutata heterogama TaxID=1316150 RepID=A0ACA9JV45_9GLOM|nr:6017_t:CDS:2 [Dentiscutata heterogama]
MTFKQKYPSYKKLASYLKRDKKSFLGFLLCYQDTIVATTSATSRRQDLEYTWIRVTSSGLRQARRITRYNKLVTTPGSLFGHYNFVIDKDLLILEKESIMCLLLGMPFII